MTDQALDSRDGRKQKESDIIIIIIVLKDAIDILELGQARLNDGLSMWEEGRVQYDSQIYGMSLWVDEVATSEMETFEKKQILTRVGKQNEDLSFSHVECELSVENIKVETSSKEPLSDAGRGPDGKSGCSWQTGGVYSRGESPRLPRGHGCVN